MAVQVVDAAQPKSALTAELRAYVAPIAGVVIRITS